MNKNMKKEKITLEKVSVVLCEDIRQCKFYFDQEKNDKQWSSVSVVWLELKNKNGRKIFITPDNAYHRICGMKLFDISEKGMPYKHHLYPKAMEWLKSRLLNEYE